jgi:hypothetical protein
MPCDEICGWCSYNEHHKCLLYMHIGTSEQHRCQCQCRLNTAAQSHYDNRKHIERMMSHRPFADITD